MGGSESTDKGKDMSIGDNIQQLFRNSPYLDNAYPLTKEEDIRYGEYSTLEVSYDKKIVKKRLKVKDDRQFQTYLKNKQQRINFDPNLFVKLLDYDAGAMPENESEDGTYKYYIDCYFEHHENDLRQEIKNRSSNYQQFSPEEMKSFMNFFIRSGTILEGLSSRHGDLRPEFVVLTEEMKPLLMDNVRDKAGYGPRLAFVTNIDKYCSPLLFKHYCRNVAKFKHDKLKDDIFSAGLILLEAGTLESVQPIYDLEEGKVNRETLLEMIDKFEQNYPNHPELGKTIRSMLVVDDVDRPTFKDLAGSSAPAQQQQAYKPQPRPQLTSFNYAAHGQSMGAIANTASYGQTQVYGNYAQPQQTAYAQPQPTAFAQPQPVYGQTAGGYGAVQAQPAGYGQGYGQQNYYQAQPQAANPLQSRLGATTTTTSNARGYW